MRPIALVGYKQYEKQEREGLPTGEKWILLS